MLNTLGSSSLFTKLWYLLTNVVIITRLNVDITIFGLLECLHYMYMLYR